MNNQELLMMFIKDLYKSQTGKISKTTARAAMKYVSKDKKLNEIICQGDYKSLLKHKGDSNEGDI